MAVSPEELIAGDLDRPALAFTSLFAEIGYNLNESRPGLVGFMRDGLGEIALSGFGG